MHAITLTAVALLSTLAAAQIPGLPSCATSCVGNSFGSCGSLDVKCICSNTELLSGLACCVSTACDSADQESEILPSSSLLFTKQLLTRLASQKPSSSPTPSVAARASTTCPSPRHALPALPARLLRPAVALLLTPPPRPRPLRLVTQPPAPRLPLLSRLRRASRRPVQRLPAPRVRLVLPPRLLPFNSQLVVRRASRAVSLVPVWVWSLLVLSLLCKGEIKKR